MSKAIGYLISERVIDAFDNRKSNIVICYFIYNIFLCCKFKSFKSYSKITIMLNNQIFISNLFYQKGEYTNK